MNQLKQADINGPLRNGRIKRIKRADGGSLSGGQKRALVLVGNYFESSKVDFLDEPTTGMDLKQWIIFGNCWSSKSLHLLW